MQENPLDEVNQNRYLDIGTKIDFKTILKAGDNFEYSPSGFTSDELINSLVSELMNMGGAKFLSELFNKNAYLALMISSSYKKRVLSQALNKFFNHYNKQDFYLLLFYIYYYIKVGSIEQSTLTVVGNDVIDFEVWKNTLSSDEILDIQMDEEGWKGLELIGKHIKEPDAEKLGRTRKRALNLFHFTDRTQGEDSI